MPKTEQSVVINRPVDAVFNFVGNEYPQNLPRWSTSVRQISQTSSGRMGVGATLHEVRDVNGREVPGNVQVVEFVPNQTLAFSTTGEGTKGNARWTFEPQGNSTKVTLAVEVEAGGMARFAGPMIARAIGKNVQEDLQRLKSLVEG